MRTIEEIAKQPALANALAEREVVSLLFTCLQAQVALFARQCELHQQAADSGKVHLKDELMTVKEVAERMHVNFRTVYTRLKSGAYPGLVRDGRMMRVSRLTFEKWLKNRAA